MGKTVGEHLEEEVNHGERQHTLETASLPLLSFTPLTPLEGKTHFFFFHLALLPLPGGNATKVALSKPDARHRDTRF